MFIIDIYVLENNLMLIMLLVNMIFRFEVCLNVILDICYFRYLVGYMFGYYYWWSINVLFFIFYDYCY